MTAEPVLQNFPPDPPPTVYRIRDWNRHYETSRSREIERGCFWLHVPAKQDGLGRGRLLQHRSGKGEAILGCFVQIAMVAAKQPAPRAGWLTHNGQPDGEPLTAGDLAIKTGYSAETIALTLRAASGQDGTRCDWIDASPPPPLPATAGDAPKPPESADDAPPSRQHQPPQPSTSGHAVTDCEHTGETPADAVPTACRPPADVPPKEGRKEERKGRKEGVEGNQNPPPSGLTASKTKTKTPTRLDLKDQLQAAESYLTRLRANPSRNFNEIRRAKAKRDQVQQALALYDDGGQP